jgi:hypothetical protein
VNEDVDDALFTLFSHLRSRVECDDHADPTGENMVLRCTTHEKADRELLKLAENGADRRVDGTRAIFAPKRILARFRPRGDRHRSWPFRPIRDRP